MRRIGVGFANSCGAAGVIASFLAAACNTPSSTDFYERSSSTAVGGTSGKGGSAGAATLPEGSGGTNPVGGESGEPSGEAGAGALGGTGGGGGVAGTAGSAGDRSTGGAILGGKGEIIGGASGAGEAGEGGNPGTPEGCAALAPDAVDFDGHCYALRSMPRDWPAARQACEAEGAHLVTITSKDRTREQFQAENAFVWQLAGDMPSWIGATDGKRPNEPGDGTYYDWIDGEPMAFDNWSEGNPNNSSGACQDARSCSCDHGACYEHCGFQWTNPGKDGSLPGWNDRVCDHVLPYVCEWDHP